MNADKLEKYLKLVRDTYNQSKMLLKAATVMVEAPKEENP